MRKRIEKEIDFARETQSPLNKIKQEDIDRLKEKVQEYHIKQIERLKKEFPYPEKNYFIGNSDCY